MRVSNERNRNSGKGVRLATGGLAVLVVLANLNAVTCFGQPEPRPAAYAPEFVVASIKPASPKALEVGLSTHPGGRLTIRNLSLWQIVNEAFGTQASSA